MCVLSDVKTTRAVKDESRQRWTLAPGRPVIKRVALRNGPKAAPFMQILCFMYVEREIHN